MFNSCWCYRVGYFSGERKQPAVHHCFFRGIVPCVLFSQHWPKVASSATLSLRQFASGLQLIASFLLDNSCRPLTRGSLEAVLSHSDLKLSPVAGPKMLTAKPPRHVNAKKKCYLYFTNFFKCFLANWNGGIQRHFRSFPSPHGSRLSGS